MAGASRARLPRPGPAEPHPLRRRGAAGVAHRGARHGAHRRAVRPRRAVGRAAPLGSPAAHHRPGRARPPRERGDGARARPGAHPRQRPRPRARPRRGPRGRAPVLRRHARRARAEDRPAHRPRPRRCPRARRVPAARREGGSTSGAHRRTTSPTSTCACRWASSPRCAGRAAPGRAPWPRRSCTAPWPARSARPTSSRPERSGPSRRGFRSPGRSSSTRRRWDAPPGATRPPTPRPGTCSASGSRRSRMP